MDTSTLNPPAAWQPLVESFRCPSWFKDAKFGVWSHWGPQAVPGCGDWYARFMYMQDHASYRHHCRVYGHPSKVGYKDIIEKWKAERFDAEELVGFYAEQGARYFMGQVAHCDNFDLFDSKHHSWNAVNHGPKRDILGEYAAATRNAGLPFGFSEHLAWTYTWFQTNKGADTTGPYAGVPYDGNDPAYRELYFEPHGDTHAGYPRNPSKAFVESWKNRMLDAIDQHNPDMMYTDGGIFGQAGLDVLAHFYGRRGEDAGPFAPVYTYKDVTGRRPGVEAFTGEVGDGWAGVEDLEHGVLGQIMDRPWQTDTSSGPWYWHPTVEYRTPKQVIAILCDVVSKNGNLLLNYTQRPDGSLDDETRWIAEQVGGWLRVNGEAIYETRPWTRYGEGPAAFIEGEFGANKPVEFGAEDFRFTTRGQTVYAIAMGRPAANATWVISSLKGSTPDAVTLLGHDGPLDWRATPEGLEIAVPAQLAGHSAWVFRLEGL
ncbi:MAG: alpha-L-fucosidase [Planctomycetota bacterium]